MKETDRQAIRGIKARLDETMASATGDSPVEGSIIRGGHTYALRIYHVWRLEEDGPIVSHVIDPKTGFVKFREEFESDDEVLRTYGRIGGPIEICSVPQMTVVRL